MNEQTGSFGNISPDGMQAIKDALARRQNGGGGTSPLDTQSAISPTAGPQPVTPSGSMPTPSTTGSAAVSPQTQGITPQQGNPEAKLIVGALKERLKAISTTELGG